MGEINLTDVFCLVDENGHIPFLQSTDQKGGEVRTLCIFPDEETAQKVSDDNSGHKKTKVVGRYVVVSKTYIDDLHAYNQKLIKAKTIQAQMIEMLKAQLESKTAIIN